MSSPSALPPRVLLVGWDAADWQVIHPLLDQGLMPNLQSLVEGGVIGNVASLVPMLSPILWTSIATGKRAYAHGVTGFIEPLPDRSGVQPTGTHTRSAMALWNIASQNQLSSIVCGWQVSHPAEPVRGTMVSNYFFVPTTDRADSWPVPDGSVEPSTTAQNLAELRVHPLEVDAEMLLPLIPNGGELDQTDPNVRQRLQALRLALAQAISVHAVTTELLEKEPWSFAAVYYECIDQVGHDFMRFHPPQVSDISENDFELYREVMVGIYQFHDLMLGRLLQLAGEDAHILIVSDHGFESGVHRPSGPVEAARWHRPQGIFVLHGPGICVDERIEGATLLDIAPTVLTLLGLPIGDDMEGKPLVNAFIHPPEIARIPSWENVPGEHGRRPTQLKKVNPAAARAVVDQFIALGYLNPPDSNTQRQIAQAEAESNFNLAISLGEGGQVREAKQLLDQLTQQHPAEPRYWFAFAQACLAAQFPQDALPALAALEKLQPHHPQTIILRGTVAWANGDLKTCAEAFHEAECIAPNDPLTQTYLGRLYLRQRCWPEAERAFQRALAVDADNAEAHYGLSVALPRQNLVECGIGHALLAVGLRYEFPEAHFQLGALLSRLGYFERAAQALEISLRLRPGFLLAHRYLARIYERIGHHELATSHREEASRLSDTRAPQPVAD